MKDTFVYTVNAILPILLLILLGCFLRRVGPWPQDFYRRLNQLCFRVFLPVQLFCNVYAIDGLSAMNWRVIGYIFSGILVCALVGVAAARTLVKDRMQKGVIVQAAFRSNQSVVGMPLAEALGGAGAMGFAALTTAVSIPVFNILAVTVLLLYGGGQGEKPAPRLILRQVLRNPLIIGCMSGVAVVVIRQFLPVGAEGVPVFTIQNQIPFLFDALTRLSQVASPVMLMVLGTQLDIKAAGDLLPQLGLGVCLRLIAAPAAVIGGALLLRGPLGLTAVEFPSLITVSATPVAVSSAVMVQELGGDGQLAGQIVVWTTVFSAGTIFCIVYLLRFFGFL